MNPLLSALPILSQRRWQMVVFLMFAAALNYADRAILSAVLPALRADLQLSDVAMGMLGSAFLWSYALCSPLAGSIADNFSRTRIVILSIIGWSAVVILMGFVTGFPMLLVLRIGLGVTECFFLPAAFALIARVHEVDTRAKAMSMISIGVNGGMVLGGAMAGYLAQHYGWRTGFWGFGTLGILLALAASRYLPKPRESLGVSLDSLGEQTAAKPKVAKPSLWVALKYLVRVPTYYSLLLESMFSGMGMWIFFSWLPLYFYDYFGMSLAAAGFTGTFMLQACVVIGITVGGWVSDKAAMRAPHRRMLAYGTCYLICAPFLLMFMFKPGFWAVVVIISCFSFFRGVGQANDNPTLCEVVPEQLRSTAIGIMNACATGAGGCGVLLVGMLKGAMGLNAIFACISGAFLIAGTVLLLAYRFCVLNDIKKARAAEIVR